MGNAACKPGRPGVKWDKKGVRRMQPGIMELDLHGKNTYQARVAIDAALRRCGGGACAGNTPDTPGCCGW